MKYRQPQYAVSSVVLSPRVLFHRLLFGAMVLASVLLIFGARNKEGYAAAVEAAVTDAMVPVIAAVSSPMRLADQAVLATEDFFSTYAENRRLKAEVEFLRDMKVEATRLRAENQALRRQLNAMPHLTEYYVTAQVLTDGFGGYQHSAIVNAGSEQGVAKGQPVLSHDGVVGRVILAGKKSSRILLLTDNNSRIPVMMEQTGQHAILAGNSGAYPSLRYLPPGAVVSAGERLLTSGVGGMFPKGLPVGVVDAVLPGGEPRVRTATDLSALTYITIIQSPAVAAPEGEAE